VVSRFKKRAKKVMGPVSFFRTGKLFFGYVLVEMDLKFRKIFFYTFLCSTSL